MSRKEKIKTRIQELERDIKDIKFRKKNDPNREHPTDEYIHQLMFDVQKYKAKLCPSIKKEPKAKLIFLKDYK